MALIKIQGNTKIQGKTIFDAGYKVSDSDAAAYIANVEAADGATLEDPVKQAIDTFVMGCKSDSIWSSLKAACILAGARTISGALVPLTGTAPTNFNFVSADYDRKTGLKGNASSKYLQTFYRHREVGNAPQQHAYVFVTEPDTGFRPYYGAGYGAFSFVKTWATNGEWRSHETGQTTGPNLSSITLYGGIGTSRQTSSQFDRLVFGAIYPKYLPHQYNNGDNTNFRIFSLKGISSTEYSLARLSFYSFGQPIDLLKLNSRISNLMTALASAI